MTSRFSFGFLAPFAAAIVLAEARPADALGMDNYLGSIGLTAATFCPRGTLEAKGQILSVAENMALYSLFGTTYGGDGRKTFGLPDLSATVPVEGMRYCIVLNGIFPSPN